MSRLPPETRTEIQRLYAIGHSQREIARMLEVSRNAVSTALKIEPLKPLRGRVSPPPEPRPGELELDLATFDRTIARILDKLMTRYDNMAQSPETSNRDAIAVGRLIGSWSRLTRPELQIEHQLDRLKQKMPPEAYHALILALAEDSPAQINGNGQVRRHN